MTLRPGGERLEWAMGARGYLPHAEIIDWMKKGLTNQQILTLLRGEPWCLTPTTQAISMIRRNSGQPALRPTHSELLPWRVIDKHQRHFIPSMLRLEARRRLGEELSSRDARSLERWHKVLENPPQVVTYVEDDPTGQGWYYLLREPGDTDIIRVDSTAARPEKSLTT